MTDGARRGAEQGPHCCYRDVPQGGRAGALSRCPLAGATAEARKAADTVEFNTCRSPVRGCAQSGRRAWFQLSLPMSEAATAPRAGSSLILHPSSLARSAYARPPFPAPVQLPGRARRSPQLSRGGGGAIRHPVHAVGRHQGTRDPARGAAGRARQAPRAPDRRGRGGDGARPRAARRSDRSRGVSAQCRCAPLRPVAPGRDPDDRTLPAAGSAAAAAAGAPRAQALPARGPHRTRCSSACARAAWTWP